MIRIVDILKKSGEWDEPEKKKEEPKKEVVIAAEPAVIPAPETSPVESIAKIIREITAKEKITDDTIKAAGQILIELGKLIGQGKPIVPTGLDADISRAFLSSYNAVKLGRDAACDEKQLLAMAAAGLIMGLEGSSSGVKILKEALGRHLNLEADEVVRVMNLLALYENR
ncbi:hypothetical protein HZC35_05960 [Candidatus Saganbacteria bacterium]|nr:hypothetical protein [Candidatus Saganbacteria bacterium]